MATTFPTLPKIFFPSVMAVEHLKASEAPERVVEILQRDGCCVVDRIVPRTRLREEISCCLRYCTPGARSAEREPEPEPAGEPGS